MRQIDELWSVHLSSPDGVVRLLALSDICHFRRRERDAARPQTEEINSEAPRRGGGPSVCSPATFLVGPVRKSSQQEVQGFKGRCDRDGHVARFRANEAFTTARRCDKNLDQRTSAARIRSDGGAELAFLSQGNDHETRLDHEIVWCQFLEHRNWSGITVAGGSYRVDPSLVFQSRPSIPVRRRPAD